MLQVVECDTEKPDGQDATRKIMESGDAAKILDGFDAKLVISRWCWW
jgi:hypothetical protein